MLLFVISLLLSAATLFGADLASEGIHALDSGVVQQRDIKRGPVVSSEQISDAEIFQLYRSNASTYYLSSGAAGDTFAVYLQPLAPCSLHYILQNWYDAGEVEAYLWEPDPRWLERFPGGGVNADNGARGTVHRSPLGEVIAGPVTAVSETYGWQYMMDKNLLEGTEKILRNNGESFFAGFVKKGEDPHPLSSDVRDICYTWFGGPWALSYNDTNACWGMYSSTSPLDLNLIAGVSYSCPRLELKSISILPSTLNGNMERTACSWVYYFMDENAEDIRAWLVWFAVDIGGTTVFYDSVEVFDPDGDHYFYGTIPPMDLAPGAEVRHWFSAIMYEYDYYSEKDKNYHYAILSPASEEKTVLWLQDGAFGGLNGETTPRNRGGSTYLATGELGIRYQFEYYDVAENNGFDEYLIDQKNWDAILVTGSNSTAIPMLAGDFNPFEQYLDNGGSLIYIDPDYLYARDVTGSYIFSEGDFAYDILGLRGGTSDPMPDLSFIGVAGTITDAFTSDPYNIVPHQLKNLGYTANLLSDFLQPVDAENDVLFTGANDGEIYAVQHSLDGGGTAVYFAFDLTLAADTIHVNADGYLPPTEQQLTLLANLLNLVGVSTSEADDSAELPDRVTLHPNYPNPFNPSTEIRFTLPEAGAVNVAVFNLIGQKVATLADERFEAGTHSVNFNGRDLPSGVYLCRMTSGSFAQTQKLVLVK